MDTVYSERGTLTRLWSQSLFLFMIDGKPIILLFIKRDRIDKRGE
ncbi:hypothetical protein CU026_2502 [Enterococcus faecium]|nr:hypothetical protein M7W_1576 [Enterococcus faecium ATCC 8459 = NRRL B-2354]EFF21048.1 hypothetical protein EfmE1071_0816 [Enterococcus faecium E1071]EFF23435.1 hypothetical protein EfmE1636_1443 [Enterococcus faecium E1636]EFF26646.1 hypothetical protein EfmE1679_1279 [Enterococcus faecium E1679]EFF30807.1 hypothetical protein EfmU0317_0027 [Enterococcus faecium U0317]EFF31661.1 hypothetical protein EfmE1039_1777 [Enterococcus faecium E1039]EFF34102.1 hypothetical protein EfmE1162_2045 [E